MASLGEIFKYDSEGNIDYNRSLQELYSKSNKPKPKARKSFDTSLFSGDDVDDSTWNIEDNTDKSLDLLIDENESEDVDDSEWYPEGVGNEGDSQYMKYIFGGLPNANIKNTIFSSIAPKTAAKFGVKGGSRISNPAGWAMGIADAIDYGLFPIYDYLPEANLPEWIGGGTTSDWLSWRGPGQDSWLPNAWKNQNPHDAEHSYGYGRYLYDKNNLQSHQKDRDPNTSEYEIKHGRKYEH